MISEIDMAIRDYFGSLSLPDDPTLYDRLVLSLREKDLIATFNWDPFLVQALQRSAKYAKSPQVAFLHGNVAVGYCDAHEPVFQGPSGSTCRTCGESLKSAPLLYPVQQKNYIDNQYISAAWRKLKLFLEHAYILTVFGYSAPKSDVEAVALMKNGWGETDKRYFEEIEVIDIKGYEALYATWSPFICSGHWKVWKSFNESLMARWPRRSCEALYAQQIEGQWIDTEPMPSDNEWSKLQRWVTACASIERDVDV